MDGETSRGAASTVREARPEAAASYTKLLIDYPELAHQSHQQLMAAARSEQLVVGERPLCNVLRPRFLSAQQSSELSQISRRLAAVFERVGERLLHSPALLDLIWATEQERAFWEVNPGFPGFTITSRLDSFMTDGRPRFVEYNAESPASIGFCDILSEIFLALPSHQHWEQGRAVARFHTRRCLLETLLWAYGSWGGSGKPVIAIIDWEDVITRRDFELCAEHFRESGVDTVIADPRRLTYRGGKLRLGELPVTLVYRRVLLHELLEKADEAQGVLDAYREGAVCMANSPRSKMLHKKALMALLSEDRPELDLSDEDKTLVEEAIPWTRRLVSGATTYGGRQVDLADFVLENKDRIALKPSDDYGGRGVVLGWEASTEEWKQAVEAAMDREYVVQERVPVPDEDFPVWNGGVGTVGEAGTANERGAVRQTGTVSLLVDTNPLLFRGEMGGILTRVSGSALLNVSAGTGSTTPTFIVDMEK